MADATPEDDEPVFLPAEVEVPALTVPVAASTPTGRIEIELSGGCRISTEGGFDADVLARFLKALST